MASTDTAVRWAGALSIALVLSACSAEPTSEEVEQRAREIQQWMGARNEGGVAGTLGAGAGLVSPLDEVPHDQAGRQTPGVTLSYETPVVLEGVLASCFGDGTVDLTVHVATVSGEITYDTSTEFPDLPCGEDSELTLEADDVTAIGFSVSGVERDGAYSAVALGTPPP
ncbi:hypothetical protein Sked_27220 [Sanguibacter keddieii DSM 10542]|uniref:Lipoprotein n=1 Tax=Sanguibacter keddieii (strain ATCC 51767 / DSM 10542 / NCFB 3025 / ST-74) TaxID=446469 RepID=D1BAS5_SANKS|nr:hypothetical protein [Sanguibacter keddieii]ACZ22626.1 hypothetical protein Sked_27220 [Sanguibacter keddieii DSM 10542]